MVTLAEDAVSKIRSGVTTVAEVARVLGELQEVRTLCAICGTVIDGDFAACPHCGTRLGSPCPHCGRTLRHGWNFCPYCARSAAPAG
ncbi:MAG TPA: zinc ribbon domain-containing protein, partial [Rhodanobacteraceae bacterium]